MLIMCLETDPLLRDITEGYFPIREYQSMAQSWVREELHSADSTMHIVYLIKTHAQDLFGIVICVTHAAVLEYLHIMIWPQYHELIKTCLVLFKTIMKENISYSVGYTITATSSPCNQSSFNAYIHTQLGTGAM
jgi:hypothetical protein